MSAEPEYIDVAGTAAALTAMGIPTSERQVYRLFEKADLPGIKVRGRWFVRRDAIAAHLRTLEERRHAA